MLLLSKMSFEECRKNGITRETRISLPLWKKKKIEVQLVCSFSNEISFILIFILQQTTSIHSHSFNIIKSSKSKSKIKTEWEKKETKKMNIINNHRTNRKPYSFNARVKRVRTNYTPPTTRFYSYGTKIIFPFIRKWHHYGQLAITSYIHSPSFLSLFYHTLLV